MKQRVYVETSVISYVTAWPSRDLIVAALHVAAAAWHGAEYVLTWNCRHIASARVRPRIDALCRSRGITAPQLCTPEELMEA